LSRRNARRSHVKRVALSNVLLSDHSHRKSAITTITIELCSSASRRGRHCASSGYTSERPGIWSVRSS
jgi:hypothetical protein